MVDTRPAMEFAVAHVPGSVHIALSGQYASWAARILGLDTRLIIVADDPEQVRESQLRLARVGVENVVAYLEDGVAGWITDGYELEYIPQITVQEFRRAAGDRRRTTSPCWTSASPGRAEPAPRELGADSAWGSCSASGGIGPRQALVVHCKGGYRSSIATSLLRRADFRYRESHRRIRCLDDRRTSRRHPRGQHATGVEREPERIKGLSGLFRQVSSCPPPAATSPIVQSP